MKLSFNKTAPEINNNTFFTLQKIKKKGIYNMGLILDVPYHEKEEAKSLGARWNPGIKKWYVSSRKDYRKFMKWILGKATEVTIICDCIYIVEAPHKCFRCQNEITVIGFGIGKYYEVTAANVYENKPIFSYVDNGINIVPHIDNLPQELYNILDKQYQYRPTFSKTVGETYYGNNCKYCNVLQGEYFLFNEPDSPFFIETPEKVSALTLQKINFKNDFISTTYVSYDPSCAYIKNHARIVETGLNLG